MIPTTTVIIIAITIVTLIMNIVMMIVIRDVSSKTKGKNSILSLQFDEYN